jgi:hypothetical protein
VAEMASRRAEKLRFIDINIPQRLTKTTGSVRSISPVGYSVILPG